METDADTLLLLERAASYYSIARMYENEFNDENDMPSNLKILKSSAERKFLTTMVELRKYRLSQKSKVASKIEIEPSEELINSIIDAQVRSRLADKG